MRCTTLRERIHWSRHYGRLSTHHSRVTAPAPRCTEHLSRCSWSLSLRDPSGANARPPPPPLSDLCSGKIDSFRLPNSRGTACCGVAAHPPCVFSCRIAARSPRFSGFLRYPRCYNHPVSRMHDLAYHCHCEQSERGGRRLDCRPVICEGA